MIKFSIFFVVILVIYTYNSIYSLAKEESVKKSKRFTRKTANDLKTQKPKELKINYDILPTFEDIIEELGFSKYINQFYKIGVYETRLLLKLKKMDLHLMSIEWEGFTSDDGDRLKNKIDTLIALGEIKIENIVDPNLIERNKMKFGSFVIQDSSRAFDVNNNFNKS